MPSEQPTYKVFDGHNDVLLSLYLPERGAGRSFFERGERGHIDLPRAREGGLRGGFFAVFTPNPTTNLADVFADSLTVTGDGYEVRLPEPLDQPYALQFTLGVMASLFRLLGCRGAHRGAIGRDAYRGPRAHSLLAQPDGQTTRRRAGVRRCSRGHLWCWECAR